MRKNYMLSWNVGHSSSLNVRPAETVPATVPGAVQTDWAKAKNWPPHYYGENFKAYKWMEDCYWTYSTHFTPPNREKNERVFFVCGGVDYEYFARLNGKTINAYEGMFTPFEIDMTDMLTDDNLLEIIVFPAPKSENAQPDTRAEADQTCKPAYSYGWDWHPRLIPLGIWKDTFLQVRSNVHIRDAELFYTLNDSLDAAEITVEVELSTSALVKWKLTDHTGNCVAEKEIPPLGSKAVLEWELQNPKLWWPNGHGEPTLYTSTVEIYDSGGNLLDYKESKAGFRKVALVMYDGAWNEPMTFPMSCNPSPITLEINNRKIFAKGSNWVPPDIFPGTVTREDYRVLVEHAKYSHFNLLRIWGGGINNKDDFFEICDELGIMLWQEFPLSCNNYVAGKEYMAVLDAESKSIIKNLRSHPSIVMWCGGNELFNSWSGMTDQSLALRLLNRNCYDLDPTRPYLMTSPVMGMGHGHYMFRQRTGEEVLQVMPKARNTAYTEFGCGGPSPVEYLKTFIPEDELYPPKPGGVWESHHAYNAWVGLDTWLDVPMIEEYFGKTTSLEEIVRGGEILQCQGYKCIYEEARRQKPRCSMALNWCYNEPWPTAAGNSLLSWPAIPKPALYAVAESCRPVLASARIPKFRWESGENFNPELWVLNDTYDEIPGGIMTVLVKSGDMEHEIYTWEFEAVQANKNLQGPAVNFMLPKFDNREITLVMRVEDCSGMDSNYTLLCD
ncbi:MAG: hypothetical protein FWC32_09370 [Firmicutes bacterium]|nr:hypothetical protein [Bacillota bacterium]